ncbi:MAG: hypothetical protein ABI230_11795 [Aestuariivirga sp.]
MSENFTRTVLMALLDPWPIGNGILLLLCILGFLATLISIPYKKVGVVTLVVNAYPTFCFIITGAAKIYDKLHLPPEFQRTGGSYFLIITFVSFFAEIYFLWNRRWRSNSDGIFPIALAIASSTTLILGFIAEIDHA